MMRRMRLFYLTDRSSKRILQIAPWVCYILFFPSFVHAQEKPALKHHVIIMIDRSAGMQPERKEPTLESVFDRLHEICFEVTDTASMSRPLLTPGHDYLSIVSFGMKNLDDPDFNRYIQTGDNFVSKGRRNYGTYYKTDFDSNVINELYNTIKDIGIRGSQSGFFDLTHAFPNSSIPLALAHVNAQHASQQFNRTFIISISDKVRNSSRVGSELVEYEHTLNVKKVEKLENDFEGSLNKINISYPRSEFRRKHSRYSYKGKKYYIDVLELKPSINGLSIGGILSFPSNIKLSRHPYQYKGEVTFSQKDVKDTSRFAIQELILDYRLNVKNIKRDTASFVDGPQYASAIAIEKYRKGDSLQVTASLSVEYRSAFCKGTYINSEQYPNLRGHIKGEFEAPIQSLLGIPINDWMLENLGSQQKSKSILDLITFSLVFLLLFMVFLLLLRYLTRKPYAVSANQFQTRIVQR